MPWGPNKYLRYKTEESGMAAIFVVMILMTVLALITIGFSSLMNREVRQALDRQLSAEAYYAAESGVNDARDYLYNGSGTSFAGCQTPTGDSHFVSGGDISGDGLFKYSCVTIDSHPKELWYMIPKGQSRVFKISGSGLANLSKFYIGWQNYQSGTPQFGTYGVMPQENGLSTNFQGVLQVGIYPVMDGSGSCSGGSALLSTAVVDSTDLQLECATHSYMMFPSPPGAQPNTVNFKDTTAYGSTVSGNCTNPGSTPATSLGSGAHTMYCNSIINNLYPVLGSSSTTAASAYYLRLTAYYQDLNVAIQATDNASPTPNSLSIAGVEGVVDVTGTGNDVFRRVQARIPIQPDYPQTYGLQSMQSICKLFRQPVVDSNQYGDAIDDSAGFNSDGACQMPSGSNQINGVGLPPVDITPPKITFTADSYNFYTGSGTTLRWSTSNAVTCTGSGSWSGSKALPSGAQPTGTFSTAGSYTYYLTCLNSSGIDNQAQLTITVTNPPPPPPPPEPICSATGWTINGSTGIAVLNGTCSNATTIYYHATIDSQDSRGNSCGTSSVVQTNPNFFFSNIVRTTVFSGYLVGWNSAYGFGPASNTVTGRYTGGGAAC